MRVATATAILRMTGGGQGAGESGEQQGGGEGLTAEEGEVRADLSYHHRHHHHHHHHHHFTASEKSYPHQYYQSKLDIIHRCC